jgi:nitronate monooxygenase
LLERIMNDFLRRLGLEFPLIQAPMAGVSTPEMAAAVSNAGGLGSLGAGSVDAEGMQQMIAATRSKTDRAFNVNVFCHEPAIRDEAKEAAWIKRLRPEFARFNVPPPAKLAEPYPSFLTDDAKLAVLVAERPAVVSFHFGLPSSEQIAALRSAGIVLLATATNLAEAKLIADAGIDAIVAQGYEAGGHRGVFDPAGPDERLGTLALTRLLVKKMDLPVIAAGGIMDGAGIAAALMLGAAAAQLGTAFIACSESSADAGYRSTLFSSAAENTVMTSVISGRPARCLVNEFTRLGAEIDRREVPAYPIAYSVGKALNVAAKATDEFGFGAQWAGQGAPLARALPAAELVATLRREMHEALARRLDG